MILDSHGDIFFFDSDSWTRWAIDCLRAFHHYRKDKSKKEVPKHPELERLLSEEFRTMADFRKAKERLAQEAKEKESNSVEDSSSENGPIAAPVSS